jgi:hypothetical protein
MIIYIVGRVVGILADNFIAGWLRKMLQDFKYWDVGEVVSFLGSLVLNESLFGAMIAHDGL